MNDISVAMATYNGSAFLREQVGTILNDLHADDEVVIIDDASSDDSRAIVQGFADSRIRLVTHPVNLGVRRSFEHALAMATHDVIFLCDQDDRWMPGKRDRLLACFELDPECLVALSDAEIIDADSRVMHPSFMASRGGFRGGFLANLIRNRYLGCTMAVRRDLLIAALPIPAKAPQHDMWLGSLAAVFGKVSYVAAPLIQYRRHLGNVTKPINEHHSVLKMLTWRVALLACVVQRYLEVRWARRTPPRFEQKPR